MTRFDKAECIASTLRKRVTMAKTWHDLVKP